MSAAVYLQLPDLPADEFAPETQLAWCERGGEGGTALHRGRLADTAAAVRGRRVTLLVPASRALLTHANVPTRNRQRLQQAVPFALEEHLAGDIDAQHFALGRAGGEAGVAVAVVARSWLEGWLERLKAEGIRPVSARIDVLTLPLTPGRWSVALEGAMGWVRTGTETGWAAEAETLATWLEIALAQSATPPAAIELIACPETHPAAAAVRAAAGPHDIEVEERRCESSLLTFMGSADGIELLQGPYSPTDEAARLWRVWRPTAALAATLLMFAGGGALYQLQALQSQDARLSARIEQTYREAFPEARHVVNPRVQMQRRLAELRGGETVSDLRAILAASAPALAATNGLELRAMRFRGDALEVDLRLPDLQSLDALKQRLAENAALQVEIGAASAKGDRVEGQLSIRRRTT